MLWFHLPIVDVSIPDERFERQWERRCLRTTENISCPGIGVVALYCAMSPHTGIRVGVDEDGRRTTEACPL